MKALARVVAIDGAVPTAVTSAVRAQIIASMSRDDGTFWYALDAPPRRAFEQVIQHLRRFVPRGNEMVGAEWWFRATATDMELPFHFDRDEGIRHSIVSPDVASILYLSGAGGPTVIVDATPSRRAAPTAALAAEPRPGRFVMFPGTLLHGVVPGPPSRWPRVTLLVNWWKSVPRLERAPLLPETRLASDRWGVDTKRTALTAFDPSRLRAPAAWREIIAKQATYK